MNRARSPRCVSNWRRRRATADFVSFGFRAAATRRTIFASRSRWTAAGRGPSLLAQNVGWLPDSPGTTADRASSPARSWSSGRPRPAPSIRADAIPAPTATASCSTSALEPRPRHAPAAALRRLHRPATSAAVGMVDAAPLRAGTTSPAREFCSAGSRAAFSPERDRPEEDRASLGRPLQRAMANAGAARLWRARCGTRGERHRLGSAAGQPRRRHELAERAPPTRAPSSRMAESPASRRSRSDGPAGMRGGVTPSYEFGLRRPRRSRTGCRPGADDRRPGIQRAYARSFSSPREAPARRSAAVRVRHAEKNRDAQHRQERRQGVPAHRAGSGCSALRLRTDLSASPRLFPALSGEWLCSSCHGLAHRSCEGGQHAGLQSPPRHRRAHQRAVDAALEAERAATPPRDYLGGSRLGHACERALQFEFTATPKDEGADFGGQTLAHLRDRPRARGSRDPLAARRRARSLHPQGQPARWRPVRLLGRRRADARPCRRHHRRRPRRRSVCAFPALWECKTMNAKNWRACVKDGVAIVEAGLRRADRALPGLHGSDGPRHLGSAGALHRDQQGHRRAPPRACALRRRSRAAHVRPRACGSCGPPTPASCCPASPPPAISSTAASALRRSAAGAWPMSDEPGDHPDTPNIPQDQTMSDDRKLGHRTAHGEHCPFQPVAGLQRRRAVTSMSSATSPTPSRSPRSSTWSSAIATG